MIIKIITWFVLLLSLVVTTYTTAIAQGVYEAWVKIIGSKYQGLDLYYSVDIYNSPHFKVLPDGDVYLTYGIMDSTSGMDIAVAKYSPDGNEIWTSYYKGQGNSDDRPKGIALDNSGRIFIIGQTWDVTSTLRSLLIKFDESGNFIWANNDLKGEAEAISIDNDGNIYVAHAAYGYLTSDGWFDYATAKYTPAGETAWVRHYAGTYTHDIPTDIQLDKSNNVYVTGFSDSTYVAYDYVTIVYSSSGQVLWTQRYQTRNSESPYSMKLDNSGNVYVSGITSEWLSGPTLYYTTVKYSPNGQYLWTNNMISGYYEYSEPRYVPTRMLMDDSGYIYILGTTYDAIQDSVLTGYDYVLHKLNQDGDLVWATYLSSFGRSDDNANSI